MGKEHTCEKVRMISYVSAILNALGITGDENSSSTLFKE
ncbi:hypothetical protein SAMN05421863_103715 [Nitrosomonas communis]|uniref:Uncharacterized protein n=1 Tax=Nitrosomonas communis TaxID=44574 RepID=A0A1I4S366_9PROT|nr:hypothetical protein SAMN05421863_103715 [Nitrosomonas communis]